MGELDAFISEFVVESRESLSRFERDLVELERSPGSRDTLDSAFRAIHNLKSAAGFLALDQIEAVAHAGETLLSRVRSGAIAINPVIANALLAFVDYTTEALNALELTGVEPPADYLALVSTLTAAGAHHPQAFASPAIDVAPHEVRDSARATQATSNIRVDVGQMDVLMNLVGELVLARNEMLQSSVVHQHSALLGTTHVSKALDEGANEYLMKPFTGAMIHEKLELLGFLRSEERRVGKECRL